MNPPTLLVTGDVVIDIHLYGGVKTDAVLADARGTNLSARYGGAGLTRDLLAAAASAPKRKWQREQKEVGKKGEPLAPQASCPGDSYAVELGIDLAALGALPLLQGTDAGPAANHLPFPRSYGVWTPHPKGLNAKNPVWRVSSNFGYGEFDRSAAGAAMPVRRQRSGTRPQLIVIDDGGVQFRHRFDKNAKDNQAGLWPELSGKVPIVLKMSRPVCRGDLWPVLLKRCADRLTVLVSAEDLRREDAQVSRRISWEQTAQDTIRTLKTHPLFKELARAKDVVITFQSEGALWARRDDRGGHRYWLVFDPENMEGEFARQIAGSVYGFQTCMLASLGHYSTVVADGSQSGKPNREVQHRQRMKNAIASGLNARRLLLQLGHGQVARDVEPGFPIEALGDKIVDEPAGFVCVEVPDDSRIAHACGGHWSILEAQEFADRTTEPLLGVGILVARYGMKALSQAPGLRLGPLISVDRQEIESLRALKRVIEEYEAQKVQKKPLSLAVFGPPGAGKSFAVKAIAGKVLLEQSPVLEFNLSQFSEPRELIGAFHQVRDAVLRGVTPVVFWDEFDSREYFWLQYLLAPMQDGAFQEDRITHPIGKCIFVFAGGTSETLESFGPEALRPLPKKASQEMRSQREKLEEKRNKFALLKGPDFVSRLHGHLNVLGPNPRKADAGGQIECGPDRTYPVRRALMLRGILKIKDHATLSIDSGLLFALLGVSCYRHGARSLEKILTTLNQGGERPISRSALPPEPMLDRDVDAAEFLDLMNARNAFKTSSDIEDLAVTVHKNYLGRSRARQRHVEGEFEQSYEQLNSDAKASNRAAAMRITELLELINYKVVREDERPPADWRKSLKDAIDVHIERLAEAEHLLWEEERRSNGWIYGKQRDNEKKIHPLLVDWVDLDGAHKEKDRENARNIPQILNLAGYRAELVESRSAPSRATR